jgi:hypothetical protein
MRPPAIDVRDLGMAIAGRRVLREVTFSVPAAR